MEITINDDNGMLVLDNPELANVLFDAIINSIDKDKLKELKRCPICNNKTSHSVFTYRPTYFMVETLFKMHDLIKKDHLNRGHVYITDNLKTVHPKNINIATTTGTKQTHKMVWLELISFVNSYGQHCNKIDPTRVKSKYAITEKGYRLMRGLNISPWKVSIKKGKIVNIKENLLTNGSVKNIKHLRYEDYLDMRKNIDILKVPNSNIS